MSNQETESESDPSLLDILPVYLLFVVAAPDGGQIILNKTKDKYTKPIDAVQSINCCFEPEVYFHFAISNITCNENKHLKPG